MAGLAGLVAYGSDDDSEAEEANDIAPGPGALLLGAAYGSGKADDEPDTPQITGAGRALLDGHDAAPATDAGAQALGPSLPATDADATPGAPGSELAPADSTAALAGLQPDDEDEAASILPPELRQAPDAPCDPQLEEKLRGFLKRTREQGASISLALKGTRDYRNPAFLQRMVDHQDIDQYGSAYPSELFDVNDLHEEDFIDALVAAAQADAQKASSKVTGVVEYTRPTSSGPSAAATAAAIAARIGAQAAGLVRAPTTTAGVSVAGQVAAQAKAAADSKQRERKRGWDSQLPKGSRR